MSKQRKPREKFRFYMDWLEPLMDSPKEDIGILFDAILKYSFHHEVIEVPHHLVAAFKVIKFQVDKSFEYEQANIYVAKLSDSKEIFFKIGIANNIAKRLQAFTSLGYDVQRMEDCEINFIDREEALNFEKRLHDSLNSFRYSPRKKFGGQSECFSDSCFPEIIKSIKYLQEEDSHE